MNLNGILDRFAEGLIQVDKNTNHTSSNARTGEIYLPGVKTMSEPKFVEEFTIWWGKKYPNDFNPKGSIQREVPYQGISRAKCDLLLSTDGSDLGDHEWAIEVKHIALVGNNGKNNDFGVAKILSPYLKDRSLIHDIKRLKKYGNGKKKAVVGYCFDYSYENCEKAKKLHPKNIDFINNIYEVCRKNDPINGKYDVIDMIEFADEIFKSQNLVKKLNIKKFENAWRHPCGGNGTVFGWELN